MKKFLLLLCAASIMTGCSTLPKVVADVTETLPSRSADSVMVYETSDNVPDGARPIGKVQVKDGGMTPTDQCLYSNMLALAVKKTAESGGNALHIDEHRLPNISSTCHRIWGTMYVIPDNMVSTSTATTLQQLEEQNDHELANMARDMINKRKKLFDNPKNIIKVSAGPAWIVSKLETPWKTYSSKMGYALNADYQHLWGRGFGIGINYLFYHTSFDNDFSINMNYIGPSFVCSMKLGKKWRWDASLGIGYSAYTEYFDRFRVTESNVGFVVQAGIEYMLSKNVGLGFQLNSFTMSMERPKDIDTSQFEEYGIGRLDPVLGLRVYL